jgi:hypothetical protein
MGRIIEWGLIIFMLYLFIIKPLLRISNQISGNGNRQNNNNSPDQKKSKDDYIDYEEIK